MKIKVIPTGQAPSSYSFSGDVITARDEGKAEAFDLSALAIGDTFVGVEADTLSVPGSQIVRSAWRAESGELHVVLCQQVGPGHWEAADGELDSAEYLPHEQYVKLNTEKDYSGVAWVKTALGKTEPQERV